MNKPLLSCLAVIGVAVLTACSSPVSTPSPSPTASVSQSPTPSASSSASASPSSSAPPAPSINATPVTGGCSSDQLAPSISNTEGAAGSTIVTIALTNISKTASCTLQGWPGISLVGGGNGSQLGVAADQDTASPHDTVTLIADGGSATVAVKIAEALNYSNAECAPRDADGIRIYPPGETDALFVAAENIDIVGCSSDSVSLLMTGAVQAGGDGI